MAGEVLFKKLKFPSVISRKDSDNFFYPEFSQRDAVDNIN